MKILTALIAVAALALGFVALQAKEPTYQAPTELEIPENVPFALSGEVPDGCVVRAFAVEGICCEGCAGKLVARLHQVESVREAAVDPVLMRAEVVVPAATAESELTAALTFGKYSATPIE